MCLRGRGEKKAGPAAAFAPRRQRLVQNSRWQSELVFVGTASCGGFRVAETKLAIRRLLFTLFWLHESVSRPTLARAPQSILPTASPRTIFRMAPEALVVICNLGWPRFVQISAT